MSESKVTISHKYLLICPIPFYQDAAGDVWLDELWHRDLLAHIDYLDDLSVAAPRLRFAGQDNLKRVDVPANCNLRFKPLPYTASRSSALLFFPKTLVLLGRAVLSADIVHSGVVGWPYPYGIIANPLAVLLGKPLIIVIESSPWRISGGSQKKVRGAFRAWATEAFARWSARNAQLGIFTSTSYKEAFPTNGDERAHVAPATWINENDIIDVDVISAKWSDEPAVTRFLFAGRMTVEKGLLTLLEALSALDERNNSIQFDFIGEGELLEQCKRTTSKFKNINSKVLAPVAYGEDFFNLIRKYDGVVVPSLSDEQPRIIFDAYSQAVPVIASDTLGHQDVVINEKTGVLFPAGDSVALSRILNDIVSNPARWIEARMNAHSIAFHYTHKKMHETRSQKIVELCL